MEVKDIMRFPDPRKQIRGELREVVQDLQDRPQVFWRLRLSNWRFIPHAQIPFVLVGNPELVKAVKRLWITGPDSGPSPSVDNLRRQSD